MPLTAVVNRTAMMVVMADRCVVVYTRWRIVAYGCGVDVADRGYVVHNYGCWFYHFNHLYRCWLYYVHYGSRGCYLVDNHRSWCGYRYVRAYGWYGYCC